MRRLLAILLLVAPLGLAAQSLQYRSAAGVEYRSLPDTGAIAQAQAALDADPRNAELMLALGLAQAGRMQYREAIATFTRAIDLVPDAWVLYRWRGHRYLSTRQLDLARADLERGLSLNAGCYGCLYHLGIVRHVTGDFEGAAEMFRQALPLAPNEGEHAGSIDWLWMSLSRAGRAAEAQAMLGQYAATVTAQNAYARRIRLYQGAIAPEEVVTASDTAGIDVATLAYGLGNWYLVRGDTARARTWFTRSTGTDGWPAFGFIASEVELARLR